MPQLKRSIFALLDTHEVPGATRPELLRDLLSHAEQADRLGYASLWLAEHHFTALGSVPNPAVVLAAIAARTSRIRVGPGVSVLPYRTAHEVAEAYALVDAVSCGRLNLGVGYGGQADEFAALGIDFESRAEVFEQRLAAIRDLWTGSTLAETLTQRPHPPIYVATSSPDNALAAGERGDSVITLVLPVMPDLAGVQAILSAHREGLRRGGFADAAAEVVVVVLTHLASHSKDLSIAAQAVERLLTRLGAAAEFNIDALRAATARGVACVGGADEVQASLARLTAAGVSHVACFTRFGGLPSCVADASLRRLAPGAD